MILWKKDILHTEDLLVWEMTSAVNNFKGEREIGMVSFTVWFTCWQKFLALFSKITRKKFPLVSNGSGTMRTSHWLTKRVLWLFWRKPYWTAFFKLLPIERNVAIAEKKDKNKSKGRKIDLRYTCVLFHSRWTF